MVTLPKFELPLRSNGPPSGYGWSERPLSEISTTTAFNTGLNNRDVFLGNTRCVVCGTTRTQHCHIIMESQVSVWKDLKRRGWIPSRAKEYPSHEPRNGLLLCAGHHDFFDQYDYFIRFCPDAGKFVFINYSGEDTLQQFHGKAIAVDIKDRHAPFPSIFIIHEMRVRGHNPFAPVAHNLSDNIPWQDWILSKGVFDNTSGSFTRNEPPQGRNSNNSASAQAQLQSQRTIMNVGGTSTGRVIEMNADVISNILAATYAMPSWKACQMEGTSWTGTGEENIKKYVSSIGVHEDNCPEV